MKLLAQFFTLESMAFHFIEWGGLLDDLNEAEYTNASIARLLNLPVTTVKSWRANAGMEPKFCNGLALLQLYSRIFGEEATKNRINAMHDAAIRATVTIR